jgi:tocopherol O-methyltransferase
MILPVTPQTPGDVRRHYDDLDVIYREIWGDHVHHGYWRTGKETQAEAVVALVALVAARLQLSAGQKICDIGCGYGASALYLAQHHNVAVTGLTIAPAQARIAAGLRPSAGRFVCLERDWLANGLPDRSFDHAYAIESSEHMVDKPMFFTEAWRTLRPGGRLAVCAWLAAERPSPLSVRYLLEPICREGRLPGLCNGEEYVDMARQAGFSLVQFSDISRKIRRTWSICARRLAMKFVTDAHFRAMIADPELRDRIFLLTVVRLMIALRTGAMRYGIFTWQRGP